MKRKVHVLFLLQRPEAWINIESVWYSLQGDPEVKSEVLVLPYNASEKSKKYEEIKTTSEMLLKSDITPIVWSESLLMDLCYYDAVVINHPYDRERPRQFWFDNLSKSIPVTIYIPYGPIVSGGFKNTRLNFYQPTAVKCTAVIGRSLWEKRMFKLHCPAGDDHVVICGHPRFDTLLSRLNAYQNKNLDSRINGRVCVLWNSHFSFAPSYSQSSSFSTFDSLGPEIFRYAIDNRDWLCLLWRPHPGLFRVLERSGWLTKEDIAALEVELSNLGIIVDRTVDHVSAFNASDALLTDLGSFFLEYLITRKPMLALINLEGVPLNEESSALAKNYVCASNFIEVERFFESVRNNTASVVGEEIINEHFFGLDGEAGQRVARVIKSLVCSGGLPKLKCEPNSNEIERAMDPHLHSRQVPAQGLLTECSQATPVLDKLIGVLVEIRNRKQKEPIWRKKFRSFINYIRAFLSETVKRSPVLMRVLLGLKNG